MAQGRGTFNRCSDRRPRGHEPDRSRSCLPQMSVRQRRYSSSARSRRYEHAVAIPCIGRPRPHHRKSHRARRRVSGQTHSGRYSWARYYHPGLQRFISEDPVGFRAEVNFYSYVGNSPLRYPDPLGLDKKAPDDWPPISLSGEVIPLPPPKGRYWKPEKLPWDPPGKVIPFRRRPPPTSLTPPPWVEIFPLIVPDFPALQRYLDSLTGRLPGEGEI